MAAPSTCREDFDDNDYASASGMIAARMALAQRLCILHVLEIVVIDQATLDIMNMP